MVISMSRKLKYGLSPTEYEIMEFIWAAENKLSFKEIFQYFNEVKNKNWKKQTMSTYLKMLQDAGYLLADGNGARNQYYPVHTRQAHINTWMRGIYADSFDNSIGKVLTAFTGGKKLSKKDADELRSYLKEYGEKNN